MDKRTEKIERLLVRFQESQDWKVFSELLGEMDEDIEKMVSYMAKYANRRIVDQDDIRSQLKIELLAIIKRYNANYVASGKVYKTAAGKTGSASFYRYVRYNLGSYLQDLVNWSNAKKVEKQIGDEETDGLEMLASKAGNIFGVLDSLYNDLSDFSKSIYDEYLKGDVKKIARLYKVKWLSKEEKELKGKIDSFVSEAIELAYSKNLEI